MAAFFSQVKRIGGLFESVVAFENLWLAARRAQAGKRYRLEVLRFNASLEDELHRLIRELRDGSWRPAPHRHFQIHEPKTRWISAAPYRDRVVHHALCNIIGPPLERGLIHDCWANRKGKGSHRAVLRYQLFAGRHRYALKADLRKYFPAVDHEILKASFRRVFKDQRLLHLMELIVDHGSVPEPFFAYFPGDTLFTPYERPKGLPIGNLTSQLWANGYLSRFDHWIKESLGAGAYLRFVDDFVVLHDSKRTLSRWREVIGTELATYRLTLHARKSAIHRTDDGVPFLGYIVWPDRIRVRGETVRRYRRRARRAQGSPRLRRAGSSTATAPSPSRQRSAAGWAGHTAMAGSWRRAHYRR